MVVLVDTNVILDYIPKSRLRSKQTAFIIGTFALYYKKTKPTQKTVRLILLILI